MATDDQEIGSGRLGQEDLPRGLPRDNTSDHARGAVRQLRFRLEPDRRADLAVVDDGDELDRALGAGKGASLADRFEPSSAPVDADHYPLQSFAFHDSTLRPRTRPLIRS